LLGSGVVGSQKKAWFLESPKQKPKKGKREQKADVWRKKGLEVAKTNGTGRRRRRSKKTPNLPRKNRGWGGKRTTTQGVKPKNVVGIGK